MVELPKNEKRKISKSNIPDLYIYGDSYVGKSTFADALPDCFMINTDGNVDNITCPYITVANQVTTNGRITTVKPAWEEFKEIVDELEKKQNSYKWIIIDLVEDLREHCRVAMYKKLGISHESDASYGKGYDMVKTEFFSNLKRIKQAGYHICLISKEIRDEVTMRGGSKYTTFKPNIPDNVANVLSGMVDFTARAFIDEEGKRKLQLSKKDVVFGGGRYTPSVESCDLNLPAMLKALGLEE